jgi:hypothetical protein
VVVVIETPNHLTPVELAGQAAAVMVAVTMTVLLVRREQPIQAVAAVELKALLTLEALA